MSDEHGKTPLILAVESGLNDVTRMLLLAGADPNLHGSDMYTPLNAAIWTGSFELVKMLIGHNADVNVTTSHPFGSPLHFLVRMRPDEEYFSQTADLLLQNKANVNAQDSSGFTPLMRYLCQYQAPSIPSPSALPSVLARFIEETSPPLTNSFGKTALHYAAFYPGTFDVIKRLLEAQANPLARDKLGQTPLYYCLLSQGRNLMRNSTAWSDRVQTLMRAISPEDRQRALSEAILAAAKTGLEVRLDMVLNEKEEGLNLLLNIPDNSGYQALDIAYSFGKEYETATQKLIALGGKTGSDDKKKSPTRWNKDDSSEHLHVSEDGMEVSFVGFGRTLSGTISGPEAEEDQEEKGKEKDNEEEKEKEDDNKEGEDEEEEEEEEEEDDDDEEDEDEDIESE
ncbi:hypothetical protein N0V85_008524 [Neurospora sp. IMI 360204]|nr:hypothetical protein N0V85_008524 [Neurospora sp. IMI 360204]